MENTNTTTGYFDHLVQQDLVSIDSIAKEDNGQWVLTRDIGDLVKGTTFTDQAQLVKRVDQAISTQHFKVSADRKSQAA